MDGVRCDWCWSGGLLRLGTESLTPGEHEARVVCLTDRWKRRGGSS